MSLFSRLFYRRPPNGLLEFIERVYVFDSCFSTEVLPDGVYEVYLREIISELHEEFPESYFLAHNFREGVKKSSFAQVLCEYDITVIDYPRQYEGCPLLPLSIIQHFLHISESWLSDGNSQNILLIHCERGGWPLLAFLLASLLVFKKLHSSEQRTLELIHREAPKGLLRLLSPLNPRPSQLRYLHYVARRNISPEWPPAERAISLDCLILRAIPSFDSSNGCRPVVRIFGRDLNGKTGFSTTMLFSMSKKKHLRHYRQTECDIVKIDVQCLVQGDVVLECLHLDMDSGREIMMFRAMFNTAFIRSNILMLNCEDIDILWGSKERFPKGFRAEVLFGEVDNISPRRGPITTFDGEEIGGLPIEAFSKVQELFGGDEAAIWLLKQFSASALQEKLEKLLISDIKVPKVSSTDSEEDLTSENSDIIDSADDGKEQQPANALEVFPSLHTKFSPLPVQPPAPPPSPIVIIEDESVPPLSPLPPFNPSSGNHPFIDPLLPRTPRLSPLSSSEGNVLVPPVKSSERNLQTMQPPPPPPSPPLPPHPLAPLHPFSNVGNCSPAPQPLKSGNPSPPPPPPPPPPPFFKTENSSPFQAPAPPPPPPLSKTNSPSPPPPPPPPPLPPPLPSFSKAGNLSPLPTPPPPPFPKTNNPSPPPPPPPPPFAKPKHPSPPSPPPPPPFSKANNHSPSPPPPPPLSKTVNPSPPPPPPPPPFSRTSNPSPPPPLPPPPFSKTSNPSPPPPPPPPPFSKTSDPSPPLPPPPPPFSKTSNPSPPPPPPPPPPPFSKTSNASPAQPPPLPPFSKTNNPSPPPPPPLPSFSKTSNASPPPPPSFSKTSNPSPPPPPPPPPFSTTSNPSPPPPTFSKTSNPSPPPFSKTKNPSLPPPPPPFSSTTNPMPLPPPPLPPPPSSLTPPGPPPPPPLPARKKDFPVAPPPPPPPRPPSHSANANRISTPASPIPPPPPALPSRGGPAPPPPPSPNHLSEKSSPLPRPPPLHQENTPVQPPAPGARTPTNSAAPPLSIGRGRASTPGSDPPKKSALKPLYWGKVSRAVKGSLWADAQKQENQESAPEIDISELETLFSTATISESGGADKVGLRRGSNTSKPETVHLIDLRRANNCEIMLTKIKMPLPDMMRGVLSLDVSTLDIDQVENLIKFSPTKEEMEMLRNYTGSKDVLGRCEQFFIEMMKVPRVESKLRVFSFKISFSSQVNDLRSNLNTINSAAMEVKGSKKLRQVMQTILTLGNVLNQGTARGSAVGFKLDSLLKLSDIRARNNKMTLMHYLCKLISEKKPEILDFGKDLVHLEASAKIQLKTLAEDMQAVSKGLEKVEQELTASEGDGEISTGFRQVSKDFLLAAEADVRSLTALYSEVGRNADSLAQYFGEDPARCPFEQVTSILVLFVNMFNKARDENARLAESEKKKTEKEKEKASSRKQ